jgi:hypothetical protein
MDAANTSPDYQVVGIAGDYQPAANGVACTALRNAMTTNPYDVLYAGTMNTDLAQANWIWSTGDTLNLQLRRVDTDYKCITYDNTTSTTATVKGSYATTNDPAQLQILGYYAAVRVSWLLVIKSP